MSSETHGRRSDYYSILGEQEFFVTPLIQKSITDALERIGVPDPGSRVLDIGAGECPLREILVKKGYSYNSLDIAQNKANLIDFVARIDGRLPSSLLKSGGFDLLVLTEVLEHVPDWSLAFDNLAVLLKSGGKCIVTVPFFYMLHEEPYDFWRPTDHAITHFAASRGLEVLESRRNGNGWDVLGTLLCSTSVCRRRKGVTAYIAIAPVWLGHKLLKWFFKSRMLQDVVEFQMRYYTGNFFLLQKK